MRVWSAQRAALRDPRPHADRPARVPGRAALPDLGRAARRAARAACSCGGTCWCSCSTCSATSRCGSGCWSGAGAPASVVQPDELHRQLEREQVLALELQARSRARSARAAGAACSGGCRACARCRRPSGGARGTPRACRAARCGAGGRAPGAPRPRSSGGRAATPRPAGRRGTCRRRAARSRARRRPGAACARAARRGRPRAAPGGSRRARSPGALTPSATCSAAATASHRSITRSAAAASGISTTARRPSRAASKKPDLVAARAGARRAASRRPPSPRRRRSRPRGLAVDEHVRAGEVAAGRRRGGDRAVGRAVGERVEQVLHAVARRQPGDQLRPLQPHRGLVGERAQQLLVARAEAARAEHDEQAELLVGRDERRGQQRRALVVGPQVAVGAAVAAAGEQLEQQRAALRPRAGRARRIGGDEPQVVPARLEPEQLAEVGVQDGARAGRGRLVDALVARRRRELLGHLGEPGERRDALARLRVELGVLDPAADERGGVREQVDVLLAELARRGGVQHDHADHLAGPRR